MIASDKKYMDIYRDPIWLLNNLYKKYKVIRVPTNAGWSTSNVGSGGVGQDPMRFYAYTGIVANSRGLANTIVLGLNSGNIHRSYIDWTKNLELHFILLRRIGDTECSSRFQLKESNAEGILAQRGIGLSIDNYTAIGESYGAVRGTVILGTLTDERILYVKIVLTSSLVQFWVNGILIGSLTGTAVPNVEGTATTYLVLSIINGVTGGVDATIMLTNIQLIQKW